MHHSHLQALLLLSLCLLAMNTALADNEGKTELEVIEIKMPKPTATLDMSSQQPQAERPRRYCLKNTGTRLRTKGTGRCAIGSGHIISGNEMQHRGWSAISAGARLKDTSGY